MTPPAASTDLEASHVSESVRQRGREVRAFLSRIEGREVSSEINSQRSVTVTTFAKPLLFRVRSVRHCRRHIFNSSACIAIVGTGRDHARDGALSCSLTSDERVYMRAMMQRLISFYSTRFSFPRNHRKKKRSREEFVLNLQQGGEI